MRKKQEKGPYFLYQRPNGIWGARKRRKGSSDQYFDCETTDKELAVARANRWELELRAAHFGERIDKTFTEASVKMASEHFLDLKPKTKLRYRSVLNLLLDEFGEMPIDKITAPMLSDFEVRRRKAGISPATIGYDLRVMRMIFKFCRRWGWTKQNPVTDYFETRAKKDLRARNTRERYLTHAEEKLLLVTANVAWRNRMVFAIETGLRKEEQFSLRLADVDLANRRALVRAEFAKNGKPRYVPLSQRAIEAIKSAKIDGSEFAFPRADGERFSWNSSKMWTALQHVAAKAEVEDVRWHDLRRTFGCRCLQDRRLSMELVCKLMGHSSVVITEKSYAFLKIEHLQAAMDASEEFLQEKSRVVEQVAG